ncbi:MAG: DoxX family protein [Phycisphaerales bacterium]
MSKPVSALRWIESIVLLAPLRLALGAIFLFAAWVKLFSKPVTNTIIDSPAQAFAESIKAFKIIPVDGGEQVIKLLTFSIPWAEAICGVLLILGLWTRAAATLLSAQLFLFTIAIVSVIARKMEVSCGCFGEYDWPCTGPMGWCHVWRDLALLAVALLLAWRGSGVLGLDHPMEARAAGRRGEGEGGSKLDSEEDEA